LFDCSGGNLVIFDEKVGKGGFGEVRRGLLLGSTDVAVKFPRKGNKNSARALLNEMAIFNRVRHSNLLFMHCTVVVNGQSCLILDWIGGGDLAKFVTRRRKDGSFYTEVEAKNALLAKSSFSLDGSIMIDTAEPAKCGAPCGDTMVSEQKLLVDVARGMRYLHALSPAILHMDLKPENILVDSCEPPRAKICDFGVAIDADSAHAGRFVGTQKFAAPEVVQKACPTTKSDLFSFGCVAVFAVNGKHLSEPPRRRDCLDCLSMERGSSKRSFQNVMLGVAAQCLRRNPSQRPDFSDVYRNLVGLILHLPTQQDTCHESSKEMSTCISSTSDFGDNDVFAKGHWTAHQESRSSSFLSSTTSFSQAWCNEPASGPPSAAQIAQQWPSMQVAEVCSQVMVTEKERSQMVTEMARKKCLLSL
jgi:serine/threonine protein kinase